MNRDAKKRQRPSNSPASQEGPSGPRDFDAETESIRKLMMDHFTKIEDKLERFERNIEAQLVDTKTRVLQVETKLNDIIASISFNANETDKLKKEVIPLMKDQFREEIERVTKELEKINIYAARENLVFLGIPETGSEEEQEDTREVVLKFLKDKLHFTEQEIQGIEFQRVHRCAAPTRPRPIKARMLRYGDKMKILRNARHLKGTKIVITEDLPKAVREARKAQFRLLHAAKSAGKTAFFSRAEPRKLYIERKYVPVSDQNALLEEFLKNQNKGKPIQFLPRD